MARIRETFEACKRGGKTALVGYMTAYDPDREGSKARILAACKAGLDVLELGVPFSDPTADGPAIQAAMVRALQGGSTLAGVLELAREVRAETDVPIVLFSYANPLLRYGPEKLAADAKSAGIDGVLVVDMPADSADALRDPIRAEGLDWIGLVAPTTTPERLQRVLQVSTGFVYAVSLRGVTGAALKADSAAVHSYLESLRSQTELPVGVGFGIRTPEDARALAAHADGVVVGTALVQAAHEIGPAGVTELVAGLRGSLG